MSRSRNRKRQNQKQRVAKRRRQDAIVTPEIPTFATKLRDAWRFVVESFHPPADYATNPAEPLRWYNLQRHEVALIGAFSLVALASLIASMASAPAPAQAVALEPIAVEAKLKINRVPAESLRIIPGVGEAISQRIVEEREANGPFESLDDVGERVKRFSVKRAQAFEKFLDFGAR